MKGPLWWRRVYCWLWNKWHGYPRGSVSDDGTVITLSTGKVPNDSWFYRHYKEAKRGESPIDGGLTEKWMDGVSYLHMTEVADRDKKEEE